MKKILLLTLTLFLFTSCGAPNVKSGLGIYTYQVIADASDENDGVAITDTIACQLTVDSDGIILSLSIDATQSRFTFDNTGVSTTDLTQEVKTKKELGDDYGLRKASSIDKEWYEQIAAFEEWAVGKTVEEVTGMPTKSVDDEHPSVPDVVELEQSCTIDVGDYIKAVSLAAENLK